ncbi:MAG: hypothetical protein VYD57_18820 [Pseudomonadota bacterium]|nr:hypothetical protein [Pseudomonadota bacterium]
MSERVLNACLVRSLTQSAGSINVRRRLVPLVAYPSGFVWRVGQVGEDNVSEVVEPPSCDTCSHNGCHQVSGDNGIDANICQIAIPDAYPEKQSIRVNGDIERAGLRELLIGARRNTGRFLLGCFTPFLHLGFRECLHRCPFIVRSPPICPTLQVARKRRGR